MDAPNKQMVGRRGKDVVVLLIANKMTCDEAIVHAAWLVAMAQHEASVTFADALEAVQST